MGKVNVISPTGEVVSVDEKVAERLPKATSKQVADAAAEKRNEELSSGVVETGKALGEGFLDAASFGVYGAAKTGLADFTGAGFGRDYRVRAEQHPVARTVGEIGAVLAPTGLLGAGAKAATGLTAAGLAGRAGAGLARGLGGGVIGGAAGLAVEGGLLGAGAEVSHANVSGDPLTIDSVVASAGVGAILNVGAGALAALVGKAGSKLADRAAKTEAKVAAAESRVVKAMDELESPAYNELRAAHEASKAEARTTNAEVARRTRAHEEFMSSGGLTKAIDETRQSLNQFRNELSARASAAHLSGRPVTGMGGLTDQLGTLKTHQSTIRSIEANVAKNPELALQDLRLVHNELTGTGVNLPSLPEAPGAKVLESKLKLPKTLREFSRWHEGSVAEVANGLKNPEVVSRLASDLGLDGGSTLDGIHRTLGEATKTSARETGGLLGLLSNGAATVGGHVVAGPIGAAVGGTIGSSVAGGLGTRIARSFIGAKQSAGNFLGTTVARAAEKGARGISKLGPVSAALSKSFLTGKADPEPKIERRALNRMNEIASLSAVSGDLSYAAVGALMGEPGDLAVKVSEHLQRAVGHLLNTLPAPSATNTRMGTTDWTPQHHELMVLAHRIEAVQEPERALQRLMQGDSHPAAAETLWEVYPAWMSDLAGRVAVSPIMQSATYREASKYSLIFRTPMSGLQQPAVMATLQSVYQPKQPNGSAPAPGQPNGRPPKVQSPVAGSSVSGLISGG